MAQSNFDHSVAWG